MIYLIPLSIIVAFVGYMPKKYGLQQNNYKNYLWLCGILIAVISALRTPYTGSGDNRRYAWYYLNIQNYATFQEYYDQNLYKYDLLSSEAGFYYTYWLFGHFLKDGQWALVITSVFPTLAVCRFIYKNSTDAPLSLLIYVCLGLFTFNMNGLRQAMAMSVCLFAYEFVKKQKLIPFVLTVMIAMLYHKTAMCFLPMFFLPRLKNTVGNWLFYIAGLVLCLLFVDQIIAGYFEISGEDYSDTDAAGGGGLIVVFLYLGTFALTMLHPQVLKKVSLRTALFATIAAFVAYISRFASSIILERISYYYFYFLILLIPEAMQELNDKEYQIIKLVFIVGALALFWYRIDKGLFSNFTLFFL